MSVNCDSCKPVNRRSDSYSSNWVIGIGSLPVWDNSFWFGIGGGLHKPAALRGIRLLSNNNGDNAVGIRNGITENESSTT
jgi:hypothetical protein